MLEAGLAVSLPEPVFMDKLGKVVDKDDPSAFGLPVTHKLIHPDWVLFMDEMGLIQIKKRTVTMEVRNTYVHLEQHPK